LVPPQYAVTNARQNMRGVFGSKPIVYNGLVKIDKP